MQKLISLFALFMLVLALAITANAAEILESGYCGDGSVSSRDATAILRYLIGE